VPRPRSLTSDDIGRAALAVVDRDGLAGLSMRAVAGELGMGAMSLYRYVADREEVEGLVVHEVTRTIDASVSSRAAWPTRITTIAVRIRDAVAGHPEVVPLVLTRRHTTLASLACGEAMLAALGDAGLTGRRRTIAFRTVLAYVLGAVQAEHLGALSGEGTVAMAALDPDEYPNLTDAAHHARTITADAEFRGGLAIVLRGLASTTA
jgi:AcrR family transcriptional regulator